MIYGKNYQGSTSVCPKEQAEKLAWANQQTAQGGIGAGVLANRLSPSPPQTLLYDACERIGLRTGQIHALADRLTTLADRVFGGRPDAGASGASPSPGCEAERLAYLLDCLGGACNRLDEQLSRIEQI